ncbi:hypothetical protein F5888DRAFT_183243 [Russula emetica]|nr:hypothetical protein F5888DRAFT_183243 [Russula emetica]
MVDADGCWIVGRAVVVGSGDTGIRGGGIVRCGLSFSEFQWGFQVVLLPLMLECVRRDNRWRSRTKIDKTLRLSRLLFTDDSCMTLVPVRCSRRALIRGFRASVALHHHDVYTIRSVLGNHEFEYHAYNGRVFTSEASRTRYRRNGARQSTGHTNAQAASMHPERSGTPRPVGSHTGRMQHGPKKPTTFTVNDRQYCNLLGRVSRSGRGTGCTTVTCLSITSFQEPTCNASILFGA